MGQRVNNKAVYKCRNGLITESPPDASCRVTAPLSSRDFSSRISGGKQTQSAFQAYYVFDFYLLLYFILLESIPLPQQSVSIYNSTLDGDNIIL